MCILWINLVCCEIYAFGLLYVLGYYLGYWGLFNLKEILIYGMLRLIKTDEEG